MNKTFTVLAATLAFLLVVLSLNFISINFTGFASTTISTLIASATEGQISYFSYPTTVITGNAASFLVEFKNTGSENITANITLKIAEASNPNVAIETFADDSTVLQPGEARAYLSVWYPSSAGDYIAIANVSYDGLFAEQNATFNVTSAATTTTVPGGPGGGVVSELPRVIAPLLPKVIKLEVEFPENITLNQGESSIVTVTASNGGNADLHDLVLETSSDALPVSATPDGVKLLPAGSSTMFLVSIEVPEDQEPGVYPIYFNLLANETTKSGKIDVIVKVKEIKQEVKDAITNYDEIIQKILQEIKKAAAEGRNVTGCLESLGMANQELRTAKDLYEKRDYSAAKERLSYVRMHLRDVIVELAMTIKPRPISPLTYLIFLIILALVLLLTVFAWRRRKEIVRMIRPIDALVSERQRIVKELQRANALYKKGEIKRPAFEKITKACDERLGRIDEKIIRMFGTRKQLTLFDDMKKAYIEGIVSKGLYDRSRERLVRIIISKEKR